MVDDILKDNPQVLDQIKAGEKKAIGFLVGQVMKRSQGKANPKKINQIISGRV